MVEPSLKRPMTIISYIALTLAVSYTSPNLPINPAAVSHLTKASFKS
jgi:hypothetical protein